MYYSSPFQSSEIISIYSKDIKEFADTIKNETKELVKEGVTLVEPIIQPVEEESYVNYVQVDQ